MERTSADGERARRWGDPAVAAGLAAGAVALVLLATRHGIGTTPDGVSYLGAASNLADGRGLTGPFTTMVDPFRPAQAFAFDGQVPFIQWPPLYPLLLGTAAWLGIEPEVTARVLAAACLGATVGGVAWIVARLAPRSWPAAVLAGTWVLLSPYVALLHVLVASEHLFLALSLGALWSGGRWSAGAAWRGGPSWPWGVAAVVLAAAATSTRFVGAAVVGALCLAVLAHGRGSLRWRSAVAAGVAVAGLAPALVWSQSTARAAGVATRTLAWHPPDRVQWEGVVETVTAWVVPTDAPTVVRLLVVASGVGLVLVAGRGWWLVLRSGARSGSVGGEGSSLPPRPAEAGPWLLLSSAYVVLYLLAVVATHALFDRAVPIGQRLLVPVQPPLAVNVAVGVTWWWRAVAPAWSQRRRLASGIGGGVVALAVLVALCGSWWPLVEPGRPWAPDPAVTDTGRWLTARPEGSVVASNDPALAWQSSGHVAVALPVRTSAPTGIANPRFEDDLAELRRLLDEGGGVAVVYGTSAVLNPHVAGVADLRAAGFEVMATFADAVVLVPVGARVGDAG